MSVFLLHLKTTELPSLRASHRLGDDKPTKQLCYHWDKDADGSIDNMPPACEVGDTLKVFLGDGAGLKRPRLTLQFFPAPGIRKETPIAMAVVEAEAERTDNGFLWPPRSAGYDMVNSGVEWQFSVAVDDPDTGDRWYVDPEMNVEPPSPVPDDKPDSRLGY